MFVNALLRLALVGSLASSIVWDKAEYLWIPFVILIVFLVRGLVLAERDEVRIEALAEQFYFLAFSGTISTVLGVLTRIFLKGVSIDLHPEGLAVAVALITMLIGILGMVTLREYSSKLSDEGPPVKADTANAPDIRTVTPAPPSGAHNAVPDHLELVLRRISAAVDAVLQSMEKMPASVEAFASTANRAHTLTQDFVGDVHEMHSVLDEFARLRERGFDDAGAI